MDILYYSNYCVHSQKLIQYLAKNSIINKINCICVDRRSRDQNTGQITILSENGKQLPLPVNVHSVPSVLLVSQKCQVVSGDEIYSLFESKVNSQNTAATGGNEEPIGYILNDVNQMGEKFTYYNMSSEELSSKGNGNMRQMLNYVPASHDTNTGWKIPTPEDTYKPNKLGNDVTLDKLQQQRNADIPQSIPGGMNMGLHL